MRRLIVGVVLCVLLTGYWWISPLRGQNPEPPYMYVGDWEEAVDPDSCRTLHLAYPTDCRCATADTLVGSRSAVYFNSIQTASDAGFCKNCLACCESAPECDSLLPCD